jgi:hypothetical protein
MMLPGVSEKHRSLHLQARDLACLADLGEFGILSTQVIHERHFPQDRTGVATRRRLRLYAMHNLIQSLALAVVRAGQPGRMPAFHRLTPYGAEVLYHETGVKPQRPLRGDVGKPHTILHRAGMAEVALKFTDACRLQQLPLPIWHFEYDPAPDATASTPLPKRFWMRYEGKDAGGKRTICWPDALCQFSLAKDGKTWTLAIAWEYDRSTESHAQFQKKLDGYLPWLATRAYQRFVPQAADARMFLVVPTVKRLKELMDSFRDHAVARMTRIAVVANVSAETLLTAPLWVPLDRSPPRAILGH